MLWIDVFRFHFVQLKPQPIEFMSQSVQKVCRVRIVLSACLAPLDVCDYLVLPSGQLDYPLGFVGYVVLLCHFLNLVNNHAQAAPPKIFAPA